MAIVKPTSMEPGEAQTVVSGLLIKPPYTVIVKSPAFPSASLPSGVRTLVWDFYLDGTREEDYDPTTGSTASWAEMTGILTMVKSDYPTELRHFIEIQDYYTGNGYFSAMVASGLSLTERHIIQHEFSGCRIKVTIDGKTYLDTNMFKPALPLWRIRLFSRAEDTSGCTLTFPEDWDAPWEIDIVQGIDLSAIFEEVIPVIISFATGMAVMGLLMKVLGSTAAIGRA